MCESRGVRLPTVTPERSVPSCAPCLKEQTCCTLFSLWVSSGLRAALPMLPVPSNPAELAGKSLNPILFPFRVPQHRPNLGIGVRFYQRSRKGGKSPSDLAAGVAADLGPHAACGRAETVGVGIDFAVSVFGVCLDAAVAVVLWDGRVEKN